MMFMSWPALLKAKDNLRTISNELDRMLKEMNGLNKKDIKNYKETILAEVDKSVELIKGEIKDLNKNLSDHRRYVESKSRFLKRHYKRL